jgi:hypothetical protein
MNNLVCNFLKFKKVINLNFLFYNKFIPKIYLLNDIEIRSYGRKLINSTEKNKQKIMNFYDFYSLSMFKNFYFMVKKINFIFPKYKNIYPF